MLVTKTVMVKWNSNNKKWYIGKGYIFTKYGDEFVVKVEDLLDGCIVNVDIRCDGCGKVLKDIPWYRYKRCVKEDKTYYCKLCANNLFGVKNKIKNKLKNGGKSFYDWCYDNLAKEQADEIMAKWDAERNDCLPSEVTFSSTGIDRKGYWFKCLVHPEHESELKKINDFTQGHMGTLDCKQCNSFAMYLIYLYGENAINDYWDYEKNNTLGINPWKITKCNGGKVWIFCQEHKYHGSYYIRVSDFLNKYRCSYCGNKKVYPLDSLGKLLEDRDLLGIWSKKNKKSPYEYSPNSHKYAYWECLGKKHKDYYRNIQSSNECDFRCPECVQERDESFLQGKVRLYLEKLGYTILHERNCTIIPQNPKYKGSRGQMPFDNQVKELKLIIEVMGIQHYEEIKGSVFRKSSTLHMQQVRDKYKKFIAYKQGYNYIAIPYWANDKEETWEKLIDNKINEIIKTERE